jgi:cytochrome c peroxidase
LVLLDGRKDSLWSQALGPLEDGREHGTSRLGDPAPRGRRPGYARHGARSSDRCRNLGDERRFPREGRPVPGEPEHPHGARLGRDEPEDQEVVTRAFANVGKAIASFERKLVSRAAPFDRFVEGLRENDPESSPPSTRARSTAPALRRQARCVLCHEGRRSPTASSTTTASSSRRRAPTRAARVGIQRLRADPFNTLGAYPDDDGNVGRIKLGLLAQTTTPEAVSRLRRCATSRAPPLHARGPARDLGRGRALLLHAREGLTGIAVRRIVQPLGRTAQEEATCRLPGKPDGRERDAELLAPARRHRTSSAETA